MGVESLTIRIDDVIGAEGGHHAPLPPGLPQPGMLLQAVERAVGGGEELHAEPLEVCTRSEVGLGEAVHELVVHGVRGVRPQRRRHPEDDLHCEVEPESRRCSAEQVVAGAELPPHLPGVCLERTAVSRPHAQCFEGDALAVEHAKDVVVLGDKLDCRVAEWSVVGKSARIAVAVGAHDR